jgi:hypothetical protein
MFFPMLSYIFNLGVTSGIFPCLWEETAVATVFKKG